ncbi:MDR family MFS transporter [Candidatus Nanosynbacter lyticus]|uniref:MDR family MFS transporter n=1 Tax=Candidatus Nanosynbacter lyticus TaxID=2093824 RepID=UPI002555AD53|nr:MDR family MFS transporter [Candidatus Nanosynbacter lyticus]WLD47164.1 MFS transporter [Candidatus Nanosynbacter lyticus]
MLHELSIRNKLIVMSAVMSALFLVALDQTIVSTALAAIVKEFNSFSSLGFIVTAYMLTTTVTVPLAGKLSDMYGRKPLLLAGVSIFTIGSLLSGLAPTVEWLIAWRALQGIGGGIITANAFTIVGDLFPPKERSKWQGLFGAVFGMSSVAGPLIGGWLTDGVSLFGMVSDWRWTFLINVPIGVIATILIIRYCPQIKHDRMHKPDYLGALFITIALATLVLAVDNTEMIFKGLIERGVSLVLIQGVLLTISVLAALGFIVIERRAKQPILPLRFFANRTYRLIMAAAGLFGAAFMGAILYLTQFNQQVFGATASQAGLMLLPMVAGSITSSITIGRLVAKTGAYKRWIVAGFGLTAVGVAVLTILQPESPYWHEAVVAVFVGLGFGAAMPILTLAVQNEFTQKDLGAATSSVQLFRGLGSTIGAAVLSGVLTAGILAHVGDPHQLPYIQSLQRSPAAQQMLSGELNADVLLRLNAQKETIAKAAAQGLKRLPAPAQAQAKQQFNQQQDEFTKVILHAFTDGLHQVFLISSGLMVVAMIAVMPVREKRLRG